MSALARVTVQAPAPVPAAHHLANQAPVIPAAPAARPTRLRPNWSNIAALTVTVASVLLVTWGMLAVAADQVVAL